MQIDLKLPADDATIRSEVDRLTAEIRYRQGEIEILSSAIQHYRKQCKHLRQVTGRNERDGSWGNPCPVCGYSY